MHTHRVPAQNMLTSVKDSGPGITGTTVSKERDAHSSSSKCGAVPGLYMPEFLLGLSHQHGAGHSWMYFLPKATIFTIYHFLIRYLA